MKFKIYADASQVFNVLSRLSALLQQTKTHTIRINADTSGLAAQLRSIQYNLQRSLPLAYRYGTYREVSVGPDVIWKATPLTSAAVREYTRNWISNIRRLFGGFPPRLPPTTTGAGGAAGGGGGREVEGPTMGMRDYTYMWFLTRAVAGAFEPIVAGFERAVSVFEDAAMGFRKTAIVGGIPPQQFQQFQQRLLEFAPRIMMRPREVGELAYAYTTRGYMYPPTLERVMYPLAIASLITGEEPIGMAKSILNLMQTWNPMSLQRLQLLSHDLTQQFADIMSYAYARSPLEPRWFKDIANYAAPIFARLGYAPTETIATFMAMSQMMATAGIAVRSMRMALYNLIDPSRQQKVMQQTGLDISGIFERVAESGGSLAEAFKKLYEEIKKLPATQQALVFRTLGGGVRGGMALLALRDVVGNIQDYINRIQRESTGFTTLVGMSYRASPLGMYQAAISEQQSLLYGLGSKLVDVKTALIDVKNALLRFAQHLPTPVVAGAVGGFKGLELYSQALHMLTNLGILAFLSKYFQGGWSGLFGFATNPWVIVGAAGLGALITTWQTSKVKSERERLEKTAEAGKYLAENVKTWADWLKYLKLVRPVFGTKGEYVGVGVTTHLETVKELEGYKFKFGRFAGEKLDKAFYDYYLQLGKRLAQQKVTAEIEKLPQEQQKVAKDLYEGWIGVLSAFEAQIGALRSGDLATAARELDKTLAEAFGVKGFKFFQFLVNPVGPFGEAFAKMLGWGGNEGAMNVLREILVYATGVREPHKLAEVLKTALQERGKEWREMVGWQGTEEAFNEFIMKLANILLQLFNLLQPQQAQQLKKLQQAEGVKLPQDLSYERILWAWYRGILPFNVLPGFGRVPDLTLHWVRGKFEDTVTLHTASSELNAAARHLFYSSSMQPPVVY